MELVNITTGKPEDVPEDQVATLLAKGTHAPVGAKALINPDGELVFSPLKNVGANVGQYGYSVPTQEQLDELSNKQQYGTGAGNVLKAGAEGVARGASFGLSDVAAPYLGADPEAMRQRRELNPTAATVGEIGGAVGSALLAPEFAPAGLVSKAGAGVAARLAPEALSEGATLASRVLGAAGEIGAKAAGSAVEGAAYGAGQSVTEAALGDPDLNAEKVMANIGYGGLFGGALGGALKAGEMALPAALEKAQSTIQSTYRKLLGKTTEAGEFEVGPLGKAFAKGSAFISGQPEEEILDHAKKVFSGEGEILSEKQRRAFYREFTGALDEHYQAVNKASQEASSLIRPQESATLLANADREAAVQALEGTRGTVRQVIAEMQSNPDLYPARFPAKLQMLADALDEKTRLPAVEAPRQYTTGLRSAKMDQALPELTAADAYQALNELKKGLDDKIPWNKEIGGEAADAVSALKELRGQIKGALEDEAVWGEAGARTASYNDAINDLLTSKKEFQKAFMKKVSTRSGGVAYRMDPTKTNSFFNMINDPRGEIKGEALTDFFRSARNAVDEIDKTYQSTAFEKFDRTAMDDLVSRNEGMAERARKVIQQQPGGLGYVTDMVGGAMAAMGNPLGFAAIAGRAALDPKTFINRLANTERAAQKVSQTITSASKALFKPTESKFRSLIGPIAGQLSVAAQEKQYQKRVDAIQQQDASPLHTMDKLELATRDLYHVAPNISASIQQTALRGTQFLSSKIPKPMKPRLPLDPPFKPTFPQMIKFSRYYNAVHRPLSALGQLKEGSVHPETIEALNTVYPQLYQEMKTEVMDAVTTTLAKKEDIPYQQRMAVSHFLQMPLDSSMLPETFSTNQATLAQMSAKKDAKEAAPAQMGKISLGDRLRTNSQNATQREAT